MLNAQGDVLALERSDIPDAWQLPQGGVHKGERLERAALRELRGNRIFMMIQWNSWPSIRKSSLVSSPRGCAGQKPGGDKLRNGSPSGCEMPQRNRHLLGVVTVSFEPGGG